MKIETKTGVYASESGVTFNYIVQRTGNHCAENVPMLVYLHGGDGVGNDVGKLFRIECMASYLASGKAHTDRDAIILSPQCPQGTKWYTLEKETLGLIDYVADAEKADKSRISITGCSLGGMGTFAVAIAAPEKFSCIVPVCSSVHPEKCTVLKDVTTWIFHGELDSGMGFSAIEANCVIKEAGGRSKLTLLPDEGHEIRHVYYDEKYALLDWMLSQSR